MDWLARKRRQVARIRFWYAMGGLAALRVNPGAQDVRLFFGRSERRHGKPD